MGKLLGRGYEYISMPHGGCVRAHPRVREIDWRVCIMRSSWTSCRLVPRRDEELFLPRGEILILIDRRPLPLRTDEADGKIPFARFPLRDYLRQVHAF